jgi:S-methylmethionine-dependent homocysteine/selenocysteine methylase
MSPLEHCFRPDLSPPTRQARTEHAEIARLLADAGVDFLLLESMNTVGEALTALDAARATGLPVWCSFVVFNNAVLSGEPVAEAIETIRAAGAERALSNCFPPDDPVPAGLDGAYAHIGKFDPPSWKFEFFPQFSGTQAWPPRRYAERTRQWRTQIVGGCCGTGPAHVRALKALVPA